MLYFSDFPLVGSIVHVSTKIAVTLFMVFLVYIPVLIAFGCFFQLSGHPDGFNGMVNTILKEGAMLTAGEVGIERYFIMNHTNHQSNSLQFSPSNGESTFNPTLDLTKKD